MPQTLRNNCTSQIIWTFDCVLDDGHGEVDVYIMKETKKDKDNHSPIYFGNLSSMPPLKMAAMLLYFCCTSFYRPKQQRCKSFNKRKSW